MLNAKRDRVGVLAGRDQLTTSNKGHLELVRADPRPDIDQKAQNEAQGKFGLGEQVEQVLRAVDMYE